MNRPRVSAGRWLNWLVLALLAGGCVSRPPAPVDQVPPAAVEPPPPAPEPAPPPPPPPPRPPLQIAAVGDLMLGTDFPDDRLAEDDGLGLLVHAAPYLRRAAVAFGNLEGVLMDGGEPEKSCKDPSLCYLFRSPARYAGHLRDAGFDVLSLANNHARDFGESGRDASMAALDAVGIAHSGREGDVATWRQGEYRLAMAAFAPNIGSQSLLDEEAAACLVSRLAADHDLVLVSFHGGAEGEDASHVAYGEEYYYGEARGNVVRFSRRMIDAGADLVIGHGPHVPRAMELYQGRLIAYSLGNFATYYGISVAGDKGVASLLLATLNEHGRLLHGEVVSMRQRRPGGPEPDPSGRAAELIRRLTQEDFAGGGLLFEADGRFRPRVSPPPRSAGSPPPVNAACDTDESVPSQPASPTGQLSPRTG